jgi:hypothetical protein
MKSQMNIDDIYIAIQYVFGFTKEELLHESRKGDRPFARQLVQWYLVTKLKYIYKEAALATGRTNHLTARHGCRVIQNILDTNDERYVDLFNKFNSTLNALKRTNPTTLTAHLDEVNGQITFHQQKGMIVYKSGILTIISDKITKFEVPGTTPLEEFISIVINLK